VLGVDNVIFISIPTSKLPWLSTPGSANGTTGRDGDAHPAFGFYCLDHQAGGAPFLHLGTPYLQRDLILSGGGLFLLAKATAEIHERLEEGTVRRECGRRFATVIYSDRFAGYRIFD